MKKVDTFRFPCLYVARIDLLSQSLDEPFTQEEVASLSDEDMCNIADAIGECCMDVFWDALQEQAGQYMADRNAIQRKEVP